MRLRTLAYRVGIVGSLLLASVFCGGWKWDVPGLH